MSEEEVKERLLNISVDKYISEEKLDEKDVEAILTILDLYQKEKQKNENKDKIISLMAEQLTTPINDKKWVIEYYTKLVEEEK